MPTKTKLTSIEGTIPVGQYANVKAVIETANEQEALKYLGDIARLVGNSGYADTVAPSEKPQPTTSQTTNPTITYSFKGETVEFDPLTHTYIGDTTMLSGSTFSGLLTKEFDREGLATMVANKAGLDATTITTLWDKKGEVARAYGTAFHAAIENYIKNFNNIQKLGGLEKVMSNVPYINDMVLNAITALEKRFGAPLLGNPQYTLLPELFVKHQDLCGFIDLLVTDSADKTVTIVDWKTSADLFKKIEWNADAHITNEAILLEEYYYQLSFYAHILAQHGYKVKHIMVVHVADGKCAVHRTTPRKIEKELAYARGKI